MQAIVALLPELDGLHGKGEIRDGALSAGTLASAAASGSRSPASCASRYQTANWLSGSARMSCSRRGVS